MIIRTSNGMYYDVSTGARLSVLSVTNPQGQTTYCVRVTHPARVVEVLQVGYASESEAQGALDEMMSNVEPLRLQPPATTEENGYDESEDETEGA